MSVTAEATLTFARANYDVMREMALQVEGPAVVSGRVIDFVPPVMDDTCLTQVIAHEPPLLTHVGELPPEEQEPVTPFIELQAETTKEGLPLIGDDTFEGLRPTELGFAAMASLTAWGKAATRGLGTTTKHRADRLNKATEAVRTLSLRILHLGEPESAESLDAPNARVVLRALNREAVHARKVGDGPRAFTAETASQWIISKAVL